MPKASARCAGVIALIDRPLRGRGMKCQLSRSGLSNGKRAVAFSESSSAWTNREAAVAIRVAERSTYAPAARARPITPNVARLRLGLIPFIGHPPRSTAVVPPMIGRQFEAHRTAPRRRVNEEERRAKKGAAASVPDWI